jgi:hypothetical protein
MESLLNDRLADGHKNKKSVGLMPPRSSGLVRQMTVNNVSLAQSIGPMPEHRQNKSR